MINLSAPGANAELTTGPSKRGRSYPGSLRGLSRSSLRRRPLGSERWNAVQKDHAYTRCAARSYHFAAVLAGSIRSRLGDLCSGSMLISPAWISAAIASGSCYGDDDKYLDTGPRIGPGYPLDKLNLLRKASRGIQECPSLRPRGCRDGRPAPYRQPGVAAIEQFYRPDGRLVAGNTQAGSGLSSSPTGLARAFKNWSPRSPIRSGRKRA